MLRLGIEVLNLGDKRLGSAVFSLDSIVVKNEEPLLWEIPEKSRDLLHKYYKIYRPILAQDGNCYLFPGVGPAPRSISTMRYAIQKPTSWVGLRINPHLMRHFAVWLSLKTHPGQYEMVRRILGHKTRDTTIRYYAGLEAEFAARALDKIVFDERSATGRVAKRRLSKAFASYANKRSTGPQI